MCYYKKRKLNNSFSLLDSSMVEHSAVNRVVVGSSPTRGAIFMPVIQRIKRIAPFCRCFFIAEKSKKDDSSAVVFDLIIHIFSIFWHTMKG